MRIIGLTGSIACGKTTVSAYLLSKGFPVVDGDRISRELTAPGGAALPEIRNVFGSGFFYEDGTLNRRRLGQLVFSDAAARAALDDLMAPFLLSAVRQRIEEIRVSGTALCFLDMPLLFEKGYDRLCDTVWTVWLPRNIQLSRLMERDGFSKEEAMNRILSVLSSDEKAALANRVIDNSGTPANTRSIVDSLLSEEMSRGESTRPRRSRAYDDYISTTEVPAAPTGEFRAVPAPSPAQAGQDLPPVMERPAAAQKKERVRRADWIMPVWLKSSLIAAVSVLLICSTAFFLMKGFLRECEDRHLQEQRNIDNHYPLLYRDLIEKYAEDYNLAPAFVTAVILNESSFDHRAQSGVGARGLMQLMPDTAEWIAGKLRVEGYAFERMYDPESNIRFGCWYLNYLSKLFLGNPASVTAAYHAGQGQVKTWLSDPSFSEDGYTLSVDTMPDGPTKNYTGRVLRDYGIYQTKYFTMDLLPADAFDTAAVHLRHGLLSGNRKQYRDRNSVDKDASDPSF